MWKQMNDRVAKVVTYYAGALATTWQYQADTYPTIIKNNLTANVLLYIINE